MKKLRNPNVRDSFRSDKNSFNVVIASICLFHLNNAYDFFCTTYGNITLISGFNMIPGNKKLGGFCKMNVFKHLIVKPTCFKGLLPSTIDLLLTNH